jgi:hypothetical protein
LASSAKGRQASKPAVAAKANTMPRKTERKVEVPGWAACAGLKSAKELALPARAIKMIVSSRMMATSMVPRIAARPVESRTPM